MLPAGYATCSTPKTKNKSQQNNQNLETDNKTTAIAAVVVYYGKAA